MKKIVRNIVCLSLLAAGTACQQFEVDTQMTPEKFAASVRLVSDALESYTLSADNPQTVIFNVSSNTPWTIIGAQEWLSVTPGSSAASGLVADVTVTARPNTSLEDRSATLVIKSDSYETTTYRVTITQNRKGKLFVQPIYKDYTAVGGPLTFTIETNQAWEVRSSEGWLTFGKAAGEPDPSGKAITVIATAERSDVIERTATVTVTSGEQTESFDVVQKAKFNLSTVAEEFSAAGGTQSIKLATDLAWTLSCDQPWMSFSQSEGVGDGSSVEIKATAAANTGAVRKATVTLTAGGSEKTFEISQAGVSFNIVPPADASVDRLGGSLSVEVNTTLDWSVSTDAPGFSAEKVDATHFIVKAEANNVFAARKAIVTVQTNDGLKDQIEISQDTNFEFEGHCEVLADGSVKIFGDQASRVKFKDGFRMIEAKLTMGEKNFGSAAQFWFTGSLDGVNIYNQLTLGGNRRLRTDGTMANGSSAYKNSAYDIAKDELNAMSTYEIAIHKSEADDTMMDVTFTVDGNQKALLNGPNPFYHNREGQVKYYFGFYSASGDGTWYVVKSVDFKTVEETYAN